MALTYVFGPVSYGLLCGLCALILGGTFATAVLVYLVSGLLAMVTLISRTCLNAYLSDRAT
jgi:hypothetical protein